MSSGFAAQGGLTGRASEIAGWGLTVSFFTLQGTYFLVADIRPLAGRGSRKQQSAAGQASHTGSSANGSATANGSPADGAGVAAAGRGATETDVDFCQRLTVEAGVTLIPVRNLSLKIFTAQSSVHFASFASRF